MRKINDVEIQGYEVTEIVSVVIPAMVPRLKKCFRDSNKSYSGTIDAVFRDTFWGTECNRPI